MLEEIRISYLLHRLNSSDNAPTGYDILKLATNGSAKVLGRDDIGSIEVDKAGDIFMINSNRLELVGTNYDPKSLLATVGIKGKVDYTIVNGKVVVKATHTPTYRIVGVHNYSIYYNIFSSLIFTSECFSINPINSFNLSSGIESFSVVCPFTKYTRFLA